MSLPNPNDSLTTQQRATPPIPSPTEVPGMPVAGPPQAPDPMLGLILPIGVSGFAIAAGYAGLFAFLIAPAPLALILGICAIMHIRKSGKKGMGRAIFGLITGVLGTIILIMILLPLLSRPTSLSN